MDKLLVLLIVIGCALNCGALLLFKVQTRGDKLTERTDQQALRGQSAEPTAPRVEADQFWAALLDGDAAR